MSFTTLRLRDRRVVAVDSVVPMSSVHGKAYLVHLAGIHNGAPNSWPLVWESELLDDCRPSSGGGCGAICATVRDQLMHNMMVSGFVMSL